MSTRVNLSPRDMSLLRLLSWTPATTVLLLRASSAFDGGPFGDERRLRERLQSLCEAGAVRAWPMAQAGGGLQNYYKLTPLGFDMTCGAEALRPSRAFFAEVSPSLVVHTFRLAELIVETLRACSARRVTIARFIRENELKFRAGDRQVQPDCFFRLGVSGRLFNLAFEIDNSMASVDANATNSIRQKLTTYERYQELLLSQWLAGGKKWERPRFRVAFLTQSISRAYLILAARSRNCPNTFTSPRVRRAARYLRHGSRAAFRASLSRPCGHLAIAHQLASDRPFPESPSSPGETRGFSACGLLRCPTAAYLTRWIEA